MTELGKILVENMPIYSDISVIQKELELTDEAVRLSNSMLLPPLNSIKNIEDLEK